MKTERSYSYWEKNTGVTALIRSKREIPSSLDILIVGAGFCGSWLAYFLKKEAPKLRIGIVERDLISFGASTRNAGFLSCGNISEWMEDLEYLGWENALFTLQARIAGVQTILAEFGDKIDVQYVGSIDCDEFTDAKQNLMKRFNEFLSERKIKPFFETKKITLGNREQLVAFNSFDAQVNPCQLLFALHEHLQKLGIEFFWQTEVKEIANGKATLIGQEASQSVDYQYGFICTNAFASHLNPKTFVEPARGQIIVTSPIQTKTHRSLGFLKSGYDYFRFIDDRLLVGGGRLNFKDEENTDCIATTQNIRRYLVNLATKVLGHSDFAVDCHWAGIMGMRKGQHASIQDMQKIVLADVRTQELAGCGGWGVTLTPYLAKFHTHQWLSTVSENLKK